jgi:hypothetical protein
MKLWRAAISPDMTPVNFFEAFSPAQRVRKPALPTCVDGRQRADESAVGHFPFQPKRRHEIPCDTTEGAAMTLFATPKFERFFRLAASVDVDKEDLRRYSEFLGEKIYDLLLRGEAAAKANDRDIVQPFDLPITKGLQDSINAFREADREIDLKSALEEMVTVPELDLALSEDAEATLPEIAGGLSLALARTFKIIEPDLKNPRSEHWERCYGAFELLL